MDNNNFMYIKMFNIVGGFAENKDLAREVRENKIFKALDSGKEIILDFEKVSSTTQSFIHALISDLLRKKGPNVIDRIMFKNCNTTVQKIIQIVIDYMQQSD